MVIKRWVGHGYWEYSYKFCAIVEDLYLWLNVSSMHYLMIKKNLYSVLLFKISNYTPYLRF